MYALRTGSVLAVMLALAGCQKETPPPKPGDNKPILNVDAGQAAAMNVQRGKVVQRNKNDFQQLATFYIQYETENNRAPANWEEFKAYMGREAPNLVKMIEAGDVEIVYNAKPSSGTVLVYEKKPDFNNQQFAAFGDKHVEALTPERLKQALQNR